MSDEQPTLSHSTAESPVEEAAGEDYDPLVDEDEWGDEPAQPRRARRRLLAPIPMALLAVLLLACGFFAGVEVEKGQTSSSSSGAPAGLASRLAALQGGSSKAAGAGTSSAATGSGAASGFPGAAAGAGGGITTGEVAYVRGNTLYVTNSEGNTVKVLSSAGASVTKTVTTKARKIHPGETVLVRGTTGKDGVLSASSISVSSSSTSASSASASGATSASGAGSSSLFGSGG
jgi:YVTN family beta-propeller protein